MGIYLLFFIFISAFSIFDFIGKESNQKIFLFIIWLLSTLFIGTRTIGPDYYVYHTYYLMVPNIFELSGQFAEYTIFSKFEPLYIITTSLGKSLGLSFEIFHLIFTGIFCWLFIFNISKYTPYVFISIMVYVGFAYISGWSAIRQFMAGSIFFYALKFIIQEKRFKYAISIVIATLFHYSAIVLIVFIVIRNWKLSKLTCTILILCPLMIYFSGIFSIISSYLLGFLPFLDATKVTKWTNEESGLISTIFFLWVFVLIFFIANLDKLRNLPNFNLFFNIYIFSFSMFVLVQSLGEFGRINMFNKILHALMFPYIIFIFSKSSRLVVYLIIWTISIVTYYRDIITMDEFQSKSTNLTTKFIPYKSWLFHE